MRLSPDLAEQGWAPLWSLLYLGFLFLNYNGRPTSTWLPPTVLSVCVFLPLYFRALQVCGRRRLYYGAAIALLGYALIAVNTGANTYLIYAGACASAAGISLRRLIEIIAGALVVFSLELWLLGWPGEYIALSVTITAMVGLAISAANHFHHEKRLRLAELKLSHDEVRRLAALAERERIGRDLHDLLGHTLSLITLKSELAVKLFERDAQAARREIADVERVARDALGQVRRAVTGIRTAGLSAELASARLLLESSDVRLEYELAEAPLPAEIETVLALTVREAVTNIQRHAHATRARVQVGVEDGVAHLEISDDGIGATIVPGNGLGGMRERLALLDGRLEIQSVRGRGTRVAASVPLPPAAAGSMAPATAT
ncbi:sensor histidine kinase [Dokdonella fugitiva]|nr:sensor histidine kinase [Dokdonella fugitiva]MBA8884039.1 two-component system sensor histidine kinase DesK [Dokdonella fugitiva]